jgi:hypothetical protein
MFCWTKLSICKAKDCVVLVEDEWNVNMERWWKQTVTGETEVLGRACQQFNISHRQSQMDGAVRGYKQSNNQLRHGKVITSVV